MLFRIVAISTYSYDFVYIQLYIRLNAWTLTFCFSWTKIMSLVTASLVAMLSLLLKAGGSTIHLFCGTTRLGIWHI